MHLDRRPARSCVATLAMRVNSSSPRHRVVTWFLIFTLRYKHPRSPIALLHPDFAIPANFTNPVFKLFSLTPLSSSLTHKSLRPQPG